MRADRALLWPEGMDPSFLIGIYSFTRRWVDIRLSGYAAIIEGRGWYFQLCLSEDLNSTVDFLNQERVEMNSGLRTLCTRQ